MRVGRCHQPELWVLPEGDGTGRGMEPSAHCHRGAASFLGDHLWKVSLGLKLDVLSVSLPTQAIL